MMYMRAHTIRTRKGGHGRRGSVIVLVVAVLALLAVIGTVYIVSARSELGGAAASANATNLENAQKAVNDIVLTTIGDAAIDGGGNVGGTAVSGGFGAKGSRSWDMPEGNPSAFYSLPAPRPFTASYNSSLRDQSWLADSVYRYNSNYFNPYAGIYYGSPANPSLADTRYKSVSLVTPFMFNPSDGLYDIPIYNNASGYLPTFTSANMFHVVADQSMMPPTLPLPNGTTTSADADSYINLLPFSDASGVRYRFGIRIVDTSAMANLNVGTVYSTGTNALMVSNNTFYNGYALNGPTTFVSGATPLGGGSADNPASINSGAGRPGAFTGSVFPPSAPPEYVWEQAALRFEQPNVFPTTPFDASDESELRAYGYLGTLATPRAASAVLGAQIWPNTLGNRNPTGAVVSGNLNRGFYTAYSYSRALRPLPDPTDSNGVPAAYQIAPMAPAWAISPPPAPAPWTQATFVWPPYPAPIAANPDISFYTGLTNDRAVEAIAVAATNIATAMELPAIKYSQDESRAFAANYLTTRWNSWTTYASPKAPYPVYTMPAGPSFIDGTGGDGLGSIHIRTGVAMTSGGNFGLPASAITGTPVLAGTTTHAYLGFAAQPFINEVAISTHLDTSGATPVWMEDDFAIELYNPFDEAISLQDFGLSFDGTTVIDMTDSANSGKDQWVPPRGYFVLFKAKGQLDTAPTPVPSTAVFTDAGSLATVQTLALKGQPAIFLMRRYYDRTGAAKWAPVDEYGIKNITGLATDTVNYPIPASGDPTTPPPQILFEARPNLDDTSDAAHAKNTVLSRWAGILHDPTVAEVAKTYIPSAPATPPPTLGSKNDGTGAVATYVPLYDRTLERYAALGNVADRLPLDNAADFSRIMRITNEFDPTSGQPGGNGVVSVQLATKIKTPDPAVQASDFPAEASVRFDFRPDLSQWNATTTTFKPGDQRAALLLQCLAFTDRVSDFSIDLGDNNTPGRGISKLRIPGKINVNTASPEVLATIPILAQNPGLIGAIMAYRMRSYTLDPRIPTPLQTGSTGLADFRFPNEFPGYGIRSIGELEIPISLYWEKSLNFSNITPPAYAMATPPNPSSTLYERQLLWGALSNSLTTRSDTFVLYAYLEAVKMNPRYNLTNPVAHLNRANSASFDNNLDWYMNTPNNLAVPASIAGMITDDPNNPNAPLLRLARRRWVAIIDRSNANYGRYLPLVVQSPNLPPLDPRFAQPNIVAAKDLPQ